VEGEKMKSLKMLGMFITSAFHRKIACERGSVMTEENSFRDIVRYEQGETVRWSRENVVVLSGQNLAMGTVLGKILYSIPTTGTAGEHNSGGATVTSVTGGAKTKKGVYTIECTSFTASPLAVECSVTDPDGNVLPSATAFGAYTSDQINFTLTDGSPNIAVGDYWTITVADGSGYVKGIDFDAVDGSQKAYGILVGDVDATSGNTAGVAVVRDARFVAANLVYPTTSPAVTNSQKAYALAELAKNNVIPVDEA